MPREARIVFSCTPYHIISKGLIEREHFSGKNGFIGAEGSWKEISRKMIAKEGPRRGNPRK